MLRTSLPVVILCLVGAGCTVNSVIVADETELVVADEPVDEAHLLDIGIVEFRAGIEEDNDPRETRVYEEIRLELLRRSSAQLTDRRQHCQTENCYFARQIFAHSFAPDGRNLNAGLLHAAQARAANGQLADPDRCCGRTQGS